jgi:hypothetical protein
MECPRCHVDTALIRMKVNRDWSDSFICDGCGKDWVSVASFFGRKWWDAHRPARAGDAEFHGLFGLFLKTPEIGTKVNRKEFAKAAVVCLSKDLSKYQAVAIEMEQDLVTRADYAWVAGVFDASSGFPSGEETPILARVRELMGPGAHEGDKVIMSQIEPYLRCERPRIQILHEIRNGNFLTNVERKNVKGSCFKHPDDILETETAFAYLAGIFDISGSMTVKPSHILGISETDISRAGVSVTSSCRWRAAAFNAIFGGDLIHSKDSHTWVLEGEQGMARFLEHVGVHLISDKGSLLAKTYFSLRGRVLDPIQRVVYKKKLKRYTAEAELPLYGGGEDREPNGMTAETERPAPTRPNPAGLDSRGGVVGAVVSTMKSAVIRLSGSIRKRIAGRTEKCVACKHLLNTGPDHVLKGDSNMDLLAKAKHLVLELGRKLEIPCSNCHRLVSVASWNSRDLSLCPNCEKGGDKIQ